MTTLAANGIWTWFNWPNAVYDPTTQDIYFGVVTSAGHIVINRWVHQTGVVQSYDFGFFQIDDHINNSVCLLDDDTISTTWAEAHSTDLGILNDKQKYAGGVISPLHTVFAVPADPGNEQLTYTQVFQAGDTAKTLYCFHRYVPAADIGTSHAVRRFVTSTDRGATWGAATTLINVANNAPYPQIRQTSPSRFDVLFTDVSPNDATASVYHFYITIAANGTRSYFKSDGTLIGGDAALPINASNATLVYDGSATNSWVWDIANVGGTIYAAYVIYNDPAPNPSNPTVHTYRRATLSGGVWTSETITDGGPSTPNWLYSPEVHYSGGICLDPNDATSVYVSRKYGAGDWRLEKWTKSGGTWAKAVDISGNTGSVNARPIAVVNSPTTQILYWRGTYTTFQNYSTSIQTYPAMSVNATWTPRAKPTVPVWQAARAPSGVKGYWPFTDGAGTVVKNYAPGGKNGAFVGAPAWATGAYGPQLGAFSTSKYVTVDPAAQYMALGTYPFWIALMFLCSDAATTGFAVDQGNSGNDQPIIGIVDNQGSNNNLIAYQRDNPGTTIDQSGAVVANANDGNVHTVIYARISATEARMWFDAVQVAWDETTDFTGKTITSDELTFGALRRTGLAQAFPGTIVAVAIGSGAMPEPGGFTDDWMSGTFAAVRASGVVADPGASGAAFRYLLDLTAR